MPAIIKVKIVEGKDLPIMDRASDLTDAFVELRLGSTTFKTEVYRKSLNPQWDSEWYKFEVDDEELQEEYLQLKVLDHDVYSSHDMIGKVNVNLDILCENSTSNEISGFFPIYDTLHGIRGFIRVKVRIQFFNDINKYRQTSCGVQFFSATCIPGGYTAVHIFGLVNELLVNDDPEYQWIDKIRTPRASNEARQRLFTKLSGEVRRKIGLQVLEMDGNAVVGYQQHFDLEGETGVVIRAIGTAVMLIKETNESIPAQRQVFLESVEDPFSSIRATNEQPVHNNGVMQSRYVSHPVRGLSLCLENEDKSLEQGSLENKTHMFHPHFKTTLEEHDFLFFTLSTLPSGFVLHLGGIVSSRSVKLLDKINNPDEPETRESWWSELRSEIRSHAKAMGCQAVLGYSEYTTICDDLIVLSAYGTAAVIKTSARLNSHSENISDLPCSDKKDLLEDLTEENGTHMNELELSNGLKKVIQHQAEFDSSSTISSHPDISKLNTESMNCDDVMLPSCHLCHIPYSDVELSLPIHLSKCMFCRQDKVPEILFSTIDVPDEIPITGTGCMIQARVIRNKKKEKDEINAEYISQMLPFLEFDLHQQLLNKLKLKGMNAIFGIKMKLCIGEQTLVSIMTGTAVFLSALPPPSLLVMSGRKESGSDGQREHSLVDIQKRLIEVTKRNQSFYNLKANNEVGTNGKDIHQSTFSIGSHEETKSNEKLDLLLGVKETYILEVEDYNDLSVIGLLNDNHFKGFNVYNTESTPGFPALLQHDYKYISTFNRTKLPSLASEDNPKLCQWLSSICDHTLMGLRLKVRSLLPCCLMKTSFDIEITDDEYFQLSLSTFVARIDQRINKPRKKIFETSLSESFHSVSKDGSSFELCDSTNDAVLNLPKSSRTTNSNSFSLPLSASWPRGQFNSMLNRALSACRQSSFQTPLLICPLDAVPNAEIVKYVGNINLFLIRESTDVKEDIGLNVFMQKFMNDIHAVTRAHAQALGGNAILSFHVNEIELFFNPHKNQAQCLFNVSGDAVEIRYSSFDPNIFPPLDHQTSNGSINLSPVATQPPELIEEIKYKLSRAVYGTSV